MATEGQTLEQELEAMLEIETFDPPQAFAEHAEVSDRSIWDRAEEDPDAFWAEQAEQLHWHERWQQVLDWSNPPFAKWFVGGKLNVAYNCVDRHVEDGHGDQVAYHWEGEPGDTRSITYAELKDEVCRAANALTKSGQSRLSTGLARSMPGVSSENVCTCPGPVPRVSNRTVITPWPAP